MRTVQALSTLALLALLVGCTGESIDIHEGQVQTLVGAGGGVVTSLDGKLEVGIPPNALSVDTLITVSPSDGVAGAVGQIYELGPAGTQFSKPVVIAFDYDPGKPAAQLRAATYDGANWQVLADAFVDEGKGVVSGTTTHFSLFGVIYLPCQDDSTCPSSMTCVSGACTSCGQTELCNGIDDNCNTEVDEGCAACASDVECPGASCVNGVCVELRCQDNTQCAASEACVAGVCVGVGCSTDLDCAAGSVCNGDTCVALDCGTDIDCPGAVCIDGTCLPAQCGSNSDCPDGLVCDPTTKVCSPFGCLDDSQCVPGESCVAGLCKPAGGCQSDTDCSTNMCDLATGTCFGASCAMDTDCVQGQYCNDGLCVVGCIGNSNCGFGLVCDVNTQTCIPGGCTTDTQCDYPTVCDFGTATCITMACGTDPDCGVGRVCVDGVCVAGMSCNSDVDCATGRCDLTAKVCVSCVYNADCTGPGEVCVNNTCSSGSTCTSDSQCSPGVCDAAQGICVGCLYDTQCGAGMVCVDNTCQPNSGCSPTCASGEVCNPLSGTCVQCMSNADCQAGKTCNSNFCM